MPAARAQATATAVDGLPGLGGKEKEAVTPGTDKVFYAILIFAGALTLLGWVAVEIVRALARPRRKGRR